MSQPVYALNVFDVSDKDDPALSDLHSHRNGGTRNYIWHLFDKLDDLKPLLK